jgi:hypothetical protein
MPEPLNDPPGYVALLVYLRGLRWTDEEIIHRVEQMGHTGLFPSPPRGLDPGCWISLWTFLPQLKRAVRQAQQKQEAAVATWAAEVKRRAEEPATVIEAPNQKKRKWTNRTARPWMHRWETWPDDKPAPTEAQEFAAAKLEFDENSFSRLDFRLIREQETPVAWRRQGKRKPWGEVKKAAGEDWLGRFNSEIAARKAARS